jgi:hypothetical protein
MRSAEGAALRAAALADMERQIAAQALAAGAARPQPPPGAARRVLLVSLEGTFAVDDDPALAAYRKALAARGHVVLAPLPWPQFAAAAAASLGAADMLLLLAAGAGGAAPLAARSEPAGAARREGRRASAARKPR